jgi:hypothetical protein
MGFTHAEVEHPSVPFLSFKKNNTPRSKRADKVLDKVGWNPPPLARDSQSRVIARLRKKIE